MAKPGCTWREFFPHSHEMDPPTSNAAVQRKAPKKRLAIILASALVVTASVIIGVYTLMPSQVIVPDLRGNTLNDATAKLQGVKLSLGRKTIKGDPASNHRFVPIPFPCFGCASGFGGRSRSDGTGDGRHSSTCRQVVRYCPTKDNRRQPSVRRNRVDVEVPCYARYCAAAISNRWNTGTGRLQS